MTTNKIYNTKLIDQIDDIFVSPSIIVVRSRINGKKVLFAVENPEDIIQRHHLRGNFYEFEELEIIRKYFPKRGTFLDIGANVGNHSLFVLKFLGASRAIVVEPNKKAFDILITTMLLNALDKKCDFSGIGLGLSDVDAENMGMYFLPRNLGGGRLVEGRGDIPTLTGDAFVGNKTIDFIKIDVEGMEMSVLSGLVNTIDRFRPPIFIEVDEKNDSHFRKWIKDNSYITVDNLKRYSDNCNYMIISN